MLYRSAASSFTCLPPLPLPLPLFPMLDRPVRTLSWPALLEWRMPPVAGAVPPALALGTDRPLLTLRAPKEGEKVAVSMVVFTVARGPVLPVLFELGPVAARRRPSTTHRQYSSKLKSDSSFDGSRAGKSLSGSPSPVTQCASYKHSFATVAVVLKVQPSTFMDA
jgi:hypothetical protein